MSDEQEIVEDSEEIAQAYDFLPDDNMNNENEYDFISQESTSSTKEYNDVLVEVDMMQKYDDIFEEDSEDIPLYDQVTQEDIDTQTEYDSISEENEIESKTTELFHENTRKNDKLIKKQNRSFIRGKDAVTRVIGIISISMNLVIIVLIFGVYAQLSSISEEFKLMKNSNQAGVIDFSYLSELDDSEIAQENSAVEKVAEIENQILWDDSTKDDYSQNNSNIRRVYLTFDDGPSANTDAILDILDEYGVKATFFVVGKSNYTSQYKRIVDEGHTLGMHSYSHVYSEIYESVESYSRDITKLHDYLYELTGMDCNIVRFPGGSSNTISKVDMKDLVDYLNQNGMIFYDWNVSSGDATGKNVSADKIATNVIDNVEKYKNVIILFHDASGKTTTVEALPQIIETILQSPNTVLLPISQDTFQVQHLH